MKVKLTATKFAQLIKAQDIAYNLMLLSSEDTKNDVFVHNKEVENMQEFHDAMSCVVGALEEVFEKYAHCFRG